MHNKYAADVELTDEATDRYDQCMFFNQCATQKHYFSVDNMTCYPCSRHTSPCNTIIMPECQIWYICERELRTDR